METSVKQRLVQYLKSKGIGQNKFESKAGLSNGYIANLKHSPGIAILTKILQAAPDLNKVWLLTGEGDMLKASPADIPGVVRASDLDAPRTEAPKQSPLASIPGMLPESTFRFAAGQTNLINANEAVNRYWYLPDCTDCEAVAPVAGFSMEPNLPAGCFVALKRYNVVRDNPNSIPFGEVFGIVVEDEYTGEYHGYIKVLRRHKDTELAKQYWIAHSFNSEYDDFDIPHSQVRSLWLVKQHIVTDFIY